MVGTGKRVVSSSWASAMSAAHSSIRVSFGLMHGGSGSSCGGPGDWQLALAAHSSEGVGLRTWYEGLWLWWLDIFYDP